jgi:hypothetical protein
MTVGCLAAAQAALEEEAAKAAKPAKKKQHGKDALPRVLRFGPRGNAALPEAASGHRGGFLVPRKRALNSADGGLTCLRLLAAKN